MAKEKGLDRLFVEEKVKDTFRELTFQPTTNNSVSSQPFQALKFVFLWAVALGIKSGSRRPLQGNRDGLVRWEYLSEDEKRCLAMIALAETGEIKVIADEGNIQEIAEEYANEGIRILKRDVLEAPGDPLWKLADFARSAIEN